MLFTTVKSVKMTKAGYDARKGGGQDMHKKYRLKIEVRDQLQDTLEALRLQRELPEVLPSLSPVNTLRTGLLNCLNARSRGLIFRHRASCI